MSSIDKRIVSMEFDNAKFERGVGQSIKSLDYLKNSLDFKTQEKHLHGFQKSVESLNVDRLNQSMDVLIKRFSTLGIVAMTVIQDITRQGEFLVKKVFNDLFEAPVKTGFQEYELRINAIQTIMANTEKYGTTIEDVNKALDVLNDYADKTIYNFGDMTKAVGYFTTAGMKLEPAVATVKGIANMGAYFGAKPEELTRGYIQISQALTSGYFLSRDWFSVTQAHLDGKTIQDLLIEMAMLNGTYAKLDKKQKQTFDELRAGKIAFRDSLDAKWLTAETFSSAMNVFAGDMTKADLKAQGFTDKRADELIRLGESAKEAATAVRTLTQLYQVLKEAAQSGWAKTWEYIIGDFVGAKSTLTKLSDYFTNIIQTQADNRNKIFKEWNDKAGRKILEKGIFIGLETLADLIKKVKEPFANLFPKITVDTLMSISSKFRLTMVSFKKFVDDKEKMGNIQKFLGGIASIIELIKLGVSNVFNMFGRLINSFKTWVANFSGINSETFKFLDILGLVGTFITGVVESIKNSSILKSVFDGISVGASIAIGYIYKFGKAVFDWVIGNYEKIKASKMFDNIKNWFLSLNVKIPSFIVGIKNFGKELWKALVLKYNNIKNSEAFNKIKTFFEPVLKYFKDTWERLKEVFSSFNNPQGMEAVTGFWDRIVYRWNAMKQTFKNLFGGLCEFIANIWNSTKDFVINIFKDGIPNLFDGIGTYFKNVNVVDLLLKILGARALFKLIGFFKGFKSIFEFFSGLGGAIKEFTKNMKNLTITKVDGFANSLLKAASGIALLVLSLYFISKMSLLDIMKGLTVLTIIASELIVLSIAFKRSGNVGSSIISAAGALAGLAFAVKIIGNMKSNELVKGIAGISALLIALGLFVRFSKNEIKFVGMIGLAIGINLIVLAVKQLGNMDIADLAQGLLALWFVMQRMGKLVKSFSGVGKIGGFISMSVGIWVMSKAVKDLGQLDLWALIKGVGALAGVMYSFSMAGKTSFDKRGMLNILLVAGEMYLITEIFKSMISEVNSYKPENLLAFSASLSLALVAFTGVIFVLGEMPISAALTAVANFGILLVGIGGTLALLGEMNKHVNIKELVAVGGDIFSDIGYHIGNFVHKLLKALIFGDSDLPGAARCLSEMMKELEPFIEMAGKIKQKSVDGVKNLANIILTIAGASVLDVIGSIITQIGSGRSPMERFADNMYILGKAVGSYAEQIKSFSNINDGDINKSQKAVEGIIMLSEAVPKSRMYSTELPDMEAFKAQIPQYAQALKTYAGCISGFGKMISWTDVSCSTEAALGINALEQALNGEEANVPLIGDKGSLTQFSAKIKPFAEAMRLYAENISGFSIGVNPDDIKNSTEAAKGLIELENSLKPLLSIKLGEEGNSWLTYKTQEIDSFAQKLPDFAKYMKVFVANIATLPTDKDSLDKINAAADIAKAFADIDTSLKPILTINVGNIAYETQTLEQFASTFPVIGDNLVLFSENISKFKGTKVDKEKQAAVINIAKALCDVQSALSGQGGLHQFLNGNKDLGSFGTNVKSLGDGLLSFYTSIVQVDNDKVNAAIPVIGSIKAFFDAQKAEGGLLGTLNSALGGDSAIAVENAARRMVLIGEGFKKLFDGVNLGKEINFDTLKSIYNKFIKFLEEVDRINNVDYQNGDVTKESAKTIDEIIGYMGKVGANFKLFNDGVKGAETANTNMDFLIEVVDRIITYDALLKAKGDNKFDGLNTLSAYVGNITWLTDNIKALGASFAGVDLQSADNAMNIVESLVNIANGIREANSFANEKGYANLGDHSNMINTIRETLKNFGKIGAGNFAEGINNGAEEVNLAMDALKKIIDDKAPTMFSTGIMLGIEFIKGIRNVFLGIALIFLRDDVSTLINNVINSAEVQNLISTSGDKVTSWYQLGIDFMQGLINGIMSKYEDLRIIATKVGNALITGTSKALDINSPSKEMMKIGNSVIEGLVLGVRDDLGKAGGVVKELGENVIHSGENIVSRLSSVLASDINSIPVIRPVMDITNISDGVNAINSMFGNNPDYQIGGFNGGLFRKNADSLEYTNGRIHNGTNNDDVVEAIFGLRDKFDELSASVGNMNMVLDSGALVGQLNTQIDRQLGILASRRERGI